MAHPISPLPPCEPSTVAHMGPPNRQEVRRPPSAGKDIPRARPPYSGVLCPYHRAAGSHCRRLYLGRWSDGGPGRGRGHAPRAQERTPPEHDPPPADTYAQTIVRVDDDDNQPCQTARWSSSGPSCRRGLAPQTDTAEGTQPHETARQGRGYPM
jgi:hypothetical protein